MKTFQDSVLEVVSAIPEGQTMTYKEVATKAGNPNASRAVGNIMSRNWDSNIPCHRVIRSDGDLGGYNRGREQKRIRLTEEGAFEALKSSDALKSTK
ncbi:MAG: MGMT family protein [Candidatus Peregrinibacteria bacterium]|nr:MGMT family protein [Candidatus Peregrinibacteria bacterium]